jgi:hypothetical protein
MGTKQSKGICSYCAKETSKGAMAKHLTTCPERLAVIAKAEQGKAQPETLYHLRVQDAYIKDFWLDLEMQGSKTLKALDDYLRSIWLECCGHMSDFFIGRAFGHQVGKGRKIESIFAINSELNHIYDFGTSSETLIKAVSVRTGKPTTKHAIALLARNKIPEAQCIECGKPATYLCEECLIEDEVWGTLCSQHAETHPHDNYGEPIPLVNSPRLGMCGYDGPAEPPY